jgi:hypothetical protein
VIQKLAWTKAREEVRAANPALAESMNQFLGSPSSPRAGDEVYLLEYDYGDLIVDRGDFKAPCAKRHPADSTCANCRPLIESVKYSAIPLALTLDNAAEVFLPSDWDPEKPRLTPLRLLGRGEPFGVFEVLDTLLGAPFPKPPWSVSAGARSIWILAPLGEGALAKELTDLVQRKIRDVPNQHPGELVAAAAGDKWKLRVLVFPNSIIDEVKPSDPLFRVLLETGWRQSAAARHALFRTEDFFPTLASIGGSLPQIYRSATVRHLIDASKGEVPVFTPVANGHSAAGPFVPFRNALHQALRNLKSPYTPVIMQPAHLTSAGSAGYYSFRCPTIVGVGKPPHVRNFSELPQIAHDDLKAQRAVHQTIDENNTIWFALQEKDEVQPSTALPATDFFPEGQGKLYLKSPFLISGVRLVRAAANASAVAC